MFKCLLETINEISSSYGMNHAIMKTRKISYHSDSAERRYPTLGKPRAIGNASASTISVDHKKDLQRSSRNGISYDFLRGSVRRGRWASHTLGAGLRPLLRRGSQIFRQEFPRGRAPVQGRNRKGKITWFWAARHCYCSSTLQVASQTSTIVTVKNPKQNWT